MNRPGAAPQTIRGMPGNFGGQPQQQSQQQNRPVPNRLPSGKIANASSNWAFNGAVPMGGAALQHPNNRQLTSNVSFAQSLSGSQPATPLDLSEFPSLSNNSQLSSNNPTTMWSMAGSRSLGAPLQRNQQTPVSQQAGQEDLFSSASSRIPSAQGSFRFGNQGNISQLSQGQGGGNDEFPPLNRPGNGELGSERGSSLMSSLGFGQQPNASGGALPGNRGNGLLNALSANSRANEGRSPPGIGGGNSTRAQDTRASAMGEDLRQRPGFSEDGLDKGTDDTTQSPETRGFPGTIGNSGAAGNAKDAADNQAPEVVDPLAGMAEVDKWGIKGLRTLMHNYPDYHAMVVGMDPTSLGLDLSSQELLSTQVYSLFEDTPPKPTVNASKFRLPECYNVTNVQPIESKIHSFNEETLFWIFYSCPADVKQQLAAVELHSRNWRWHKRLQVWLTKDEHMTPQVLSQTHERGFYLVWDTVNWRKDRREFTLLYSDLDTSPTQV